MNKKLTKGTDANHLTLVVDGLELKHSPTGVVIITYGYDLDYVLDQLIDDYGVDEIIKRIKER